VFPTDCVQGFVTDFLFSSRELYDLTMFEVRPVMYDNLPPRPLIAVGRLLGTRAAWMLRYAHLLDAGEFTKFVILVRDLSPFAVMLINPESHSRRQDRNPANRPEEFRMGSQRPSRSSAAL
jgi:hypothetical protein